MLDADGILDCHEKTMKTNPKPSVSRIALLMIACVALTGAGKLFGQTQNAGTNACIEDQIVAAMTSYKPGEYIAHDLIQLDFKADVHRRKIIQDLLKVLNNPNLPTNDAVKCAAAHYLGRMGAKEAVDSLAAQITMMAPAIDPHYGKAFLGDQPAEEALIDIGTPSIPALIRNLTESDDTWVRNNSLDALWQIEGMDKDVTQFRLQKALDAETDATKKARLQLAVKQIAQSQH